MNLFPNEKKILSSNQDKVVLTSHRICMTDKDWGSYYSIEFFLENISSVEVRRSSFIVLLILGGLSFFTALYLQSNNSHYGGNEYAIFYLVSFVLLAIWLLSRQRVIRISSNGGGSMNMDVKQMSKEKIQNFIDELELAKCNRIEILFNRTNNQV